MHKGSNLEGHSSMLMASGKFLNFLTWNQDEMRLWKLLLIRGRYLSSSDSSFQDRVVSNLAIHKLNVIWFGATLDPLNLLCNHEETADLKG